MPLALSVFGVAAPGAEASFCYAQLRALRPSPYAPPSLSKAAAGRELSRTHSAKSDFELQVWDSILDEQASARAEADLSQGLLRLPDECPIRPGETLAGQIFAETLLLERHGRVPVDGAGALQTRGFVVENGAAAVFAALQAILKLKAVGEALNELLPMIDREAGLDGLVTSTRRLGVIEFLSRRQANAEARPIRVEVVKPRQGSKDPCREIVVTRSPGAPFTDVRVALEVRCENAVVMRRLLTLTGEEREVRADAGVHVTSLSFAVFDEGTGDLMDQEEQVLCQEIGMGLVGRGREDVLPPLFRAAPDVAELRVRPRIHTSEFAISGRGRSGGFDAMRRNAAAFDALAGTHGEGRETRFFPAGVASQVEVIRWIKRKFESPQVKEAFLVDPFLGTEALKRVLLRQGNESVKLTVVVSPGNVDPDAAVTDTTTTPGKHVDDLVSAADALAGELCGDIEIVHVQRGGGSRQAFHDRYLGLVRRDGTPSVFLLSNSLSKAAGDWPFAVAELDSPSAWLVASYVAELCVYDDQGQKSLRAASVWKSGVVEVEGSAPNVDPLQSAIWAAYLELNELDAKGGIADHLSTDPILDRLFAALPTAADDGRLSTALVEGMNGRDHFLPAIIQRLSEGPAHSALVRPLEEALVRRLLERLTPESGLFGLPEPLGLLRSAGEALSRLPKGTDVVRDRMNPAADSHARGLEVGRVSDRIKRLIAGLCLVIVGLELALAKSDVPVRYRNGIANDYGHLLGRLLRSLTSRSIFADEASGLSQTIVHLPREALRLVRALAADGALRMEETMRLLLNDTSLPTTLLSEGDARDDIHRGRPTP